MSERVVTSGAISTERLAPGAVTPWSSADENARLKFIYEVTGLSAYLTLAF